MSRKLTWIVAGLLWCGVTTAPAANIIMVTEHEDRNHDGVLDDQGLVDWLVAEGHSVEILRNSWEPLDSERVAQLEAADLVIVSRQTESSGLYAEGEETAQWNSLETPLLLLNAYLACGYRWNWVNTTMATDDTTDTYAEVVDPNHPILRGVSLVASVGFGPNANLVPVIDPAVGSGLTTFLGSTDMGNGRLIACTAGGGLGWIAEWDAGVEFYPGAGQFAGGKRLLFCAGTEDFPDPNDDLQGEFNLTPEGRHLLRNAIAYLLGGAHIILVTEDSDANLDGLRDDRSLEKLLVSDGHLVDVRPGYWRDLDPNKIAELQAADLVLFSGTAESAYYSDANEPPQWNALPVPLLQMNACFAHESRWNWAVGSLALNNVALDSLEVVEPRHPIFRDVPLTALDSGTPENPFQLVPLIDLNVGAGITSVSDTAGVGNGRLLARLFGSDMCWIAEWDAGVEFYDGAGQYTGAKRLLFCAGTQEIQVIDAVAQGTVTPPQGELNLTPEGLQMFRNAIAYLLASGPGPQP
jgi:hypothetical protein